MSICLPELSKDVKPVELRERYVDGLLDPVRLTRRDLDNLRLDLGSYGYAGQIMQSPSPDDGGIWQKWFIPVPDSEFPGNAGQVRDGLGFRPIRRRRPTAQAHT